VCRRDAGELVADEGQDEVLPDTIRDALAETEDPLSAGEVKRVLPHGAADALVEEEVVRRREKDRGRMEVRPKGPEGLDRSKGRDLLDALFVVSDLISRGALLAEPKDPSIFRAVVNARFTRACLDRLSERGGTYVRATKGMDRHCGESSRGCRGTLFSHGGTLVLIRESCRKVFGRYA